MEMTFISGGFRGIKGGGLELPSLGLDLVLRNTDELNPLKS